MKVCIKNDIMEYDKVEYAVSSVGSIIEEIAQSQQRMMNMFNEHNLFVTKALERIEKLKTESKIIKVKDPLEEIKKLKELYQTTGQNEIEYLNNIVDLLTLYESNKISATFKEIFLELFTIFLNKINVSECLEKLTKMKEKIIQIKDIRWILIKMEKYPDAFIFNDSDIDLMNKVASRDNILLVKKFLKKDGLYEEYYENTNQINLRYTMIRGKINGLFEEYFLDGSLKAKRLYKNGNYHGETRTWYQNGVLQTVQHYTNGLVDGEYNAWHENGKVMYTSNHCKGKRHGLFREYYKNGNPFTIRDYNMGLQIAEYKVWDENNNLVIDKYYDTNGKVVK